jgi:hypothetical protein
MTPAEQNIDEKIDSLMVQYESAYNKAYNQIDPYYLASKGDKYAYDKVDKRSLEIQSKVVQSIKQLVTEARIDELKKLWNDYQYDIIPEGTQPLDIPGKAILDRITELKEGKV